MDCIFCRPFKWLGTNGDCVATRRELQEKFQAWRYAQTNDQRLFTDDPDPVATCKIADLCRLDPGAALPELMALAERGSVWCMGLLAYSYEVGRGVTVNLAEAERWYRRALERGSQQAQLRLGRMVEQRRDFAECERIYAVGVADQWAPANYYLAQIKLRQPRTSARRDEARHLLQQAAAQGDLGAATQLGSMMARGKFGLARIPAGFLLLLRTVRKVATLVDDAAAPSSLRENTDSTPASLPFAEAVVSSPTR